MPARGNEGARGEHGEHNALAERGGHNGQQRLPLVIGISGSSGAALARRTIEVLGELRIPMHITYTPACRQVWPDEVGRLIADDLEDWKTRFGARTQNGDAPPGARWLVRLLLLCTGAHAPLVADRSADGD